MLLFVGFKLGIAGDNTGGVDLLFVWTDTVGGADRAVLRTEVDDIGDVTVVEDVVADENRLTLFELNVVSFVCDGGEVSPFLAGLPKE